MPYRATDASHPVTGIAWVKPPKRTDCLPDVQSDPGHPDQFDTDGGTDPEVRRHAARDESPAGER